MPKKNLEFESEIGQEKGSCSICGLELEDDGSCPECGHAGLSGLSEEDDQIFEAEKHGFEIEEE